MGRFWRGGNFKTLGGQSRSFVGRFSATGPAIQNLALEGTTVVWQRGGSAPEVWRTLLEIAANFLGWVNVGPGTRVAEGWEWSGIALSTDATIRARGFTIGGRFNNSGGQVESSLLIVTTNPPVITSQPVSQTLLVGATALFTVVASSGTPAT